MNTLPAVYERQLLIAPQELEAAIRYANIIATAKTIPQVFRNSPGDCLLVIEQARTWGMSPAALLRHCSIIQGNLMIEGVAIAAAVNANAGLDGRLEYVFEGTGNDRKIIVSGRYPDEEQPRTVEVYLRDARSNAAAWKAQPDQQLVYTGARVWGRRHAPHVMMGVRAIEEAGGEVIETAPLPAFAKLPTASEALHGALDAGVPSDQPPDPREAGDQASPLTPVGEAQEVVDPVTGEITTIPPKIAPHKIELKDSSEDGYRQWGMSLMACLHEAATDDEVKLWLEVNNDTLVSMSKTQELMYDRVQSNVARVRVKLSGKKPGTITIMGAG